MSDERSRPLRAPVVLPPWIDSGTARVEALIFDVDGTLADTEEAHRQAFNQAFCAFGLDWDWTPQRYRDLLRVTGGKERIASHLESLHRALDPDAG